DGPLGAPPMGLGGLVGTPIKKHTGGSLNLVQTLLDFGRTRSTVHARREEAAVSAETLHADQNRVTLDAQQAYLQTLQSRRLLEVNRQILEQRQLVARQAETLRQNGLASRVDVDLAELNVSQAQLAVVRAQNDVETAFAALSSAIGRQIPSTTALEDVVPASPPTPPTPTPSAPAPSTVAPVPAPPLDQSITEARRGRPELRHAAPQARTYGGL